MFATTPIAFQQHLKILKSLNKEARKSEFKTPTWPLQCPWVVHICIGRFLFGILTYANRFSLSSEPESHSKGKDPLSKSAVTYTFWKWTKSRFSRKQAETFLLFFLPQNTHQFPQPLAILILKGRMVEQETSHHFKRDTVKTHSPHRACLPFQPPKPTNYWNATGWFSDRIPCHPLYMGSP